jgi:hypothetical protein
MTQPELPFDDDQPLQLTFEDAFKNAWHNAAPNLPISHGSTPIAAGHGEFETISINDEDEDEGEATENPDRVAAPITLVPTSTTDPYRPRTVAAGYDSRTRTLTVLFRQQGRADDGQPYNYYEVSNQMWQNFKRARSKGRFIYTYLDSHPRGFAEASAVTEFAKAALESVQAAQFAAGGLQAGQSRSSRRGGRGTYAPGHLGGTGRLRGRTQALDSAVESYWANRQQT